MKLRSIFRPENTPRRDHRSAAGRAFVCAQKKKKNEMKTPEPSQGETGGGRVFNNRDVLGPYIMTLLGE
jgi:hypothetical protein